MVTDAFEYKLVIVTRQDLRLSPGKLAVQVAHAAVECALRAKQETPTWFGRWNREGAKKVVVKVPSLEAFYPLQQQAEGLRMCTALVSDAGLTEVAAGTVTVLGIGPAPDAVIDQVTGALTLL